MSDQATKILETLDELRASVTPTERQAQLFSKLDKLLAKALEDVRPPALDRSAEEWSSALLDQAEIDLHVAELLEGHAELAPVLGMILQMSFEKIAKAHVAKSNWPAFRQVRRTHAVARKLARTLKRDPLLGGTLGARGLRSASVLNWMVALTDAHPALAKEGPHLEYPWEDSTGVHLPAEVPIVGELSDARSLAAPHLLRFARVLLNHVREM